MKNKKKVCFFHYPDIGDIGDFSVSSLDPAPYFSKSPNWGVSDLILRGRSGYPKKLSLWNAEGLDRLYRTRDPGYMKFLDDFIDRYHDADVIIMLNYNPVHPEILTTELKKPIKILGFGDDPISTYVRGIPYLWAFDSAFYISPGYNDNHGLGEALRKWGVKDPLWWPLSTQRIKKHSEEVDFMENRDMDIIYIGQSYGNKINRLIELKKHFGKSMHVYGRWGLSGWVGVVRGLFGKRVYPHRVRSISEAQRTNYYGRSKIGINMHFSNTPSETGNMRMYEVPAHGAMLLCDKAALNMHEKIFLPNKEAVYYDSGLEAIELAEYYLNNEQERAAIAEAGFKRYWKDYSYENNILSLLNWASNVKKV